MRNILLIITILSFMGCGSHKNETIKVSDSDFKQAKFAFNELNEALAKENGSLWNYKLEGPILLINPETRIFIANQQNDKNDFVKHGDLYIGKLPENISVANTAISWDEKSWTMVMLPLPESREDKLSLLIHESFHRIQSKVGFESQIEIQNDHLDSKDGRIFLKLELEALKQALSSENPQQHIKKALLFRYYRHQLFPESTTSENSLELNEGIAEYTGSILSGMSDAALLKHYASKIDMTLSNPTYVRCFAYATIPIYGYFMRQSEEHWNLKISSKTNLTEFISAFFGINNPNQSIDDIKKIGKSYNIESISKFEESRELERLTLIHRLKKIFLEDSTLVIAFENMNFTFNPSNIIPLDTFGTIYPNLRIVDSWGILEVESGGALITNWKKVTIPAPTQRKDNVITGKGWELKLNTPWVLEKRKGYYTLVKK